MKTVDYNNCDCCYKEDIYVTKCSTNNNCNYSMCNDCLQNLKNKTKTNLCPACREEKVEIIIENNHENISLNFEIDSYYQQTNQFQNCFKDCFKVICLPFYIIFDFWFNIFKSIYDFTQYLFVYILSVIINYGLVLLFFYLLY